MREAQRTTRPAAFRGIALAALGALVVVAPAVAGPAQQAQAGQQTQPAAPQRPGGFIDRILVKVNGQPILQTELEQALEDNMGPLRAQFTPEQLEAMDEQLRMGMLQSMIDSLMLRQRAEEIGLQATANDVDRALARLMEQNGFTSEEQLDQALAAQGLTRAQLREQMRSTIIEQRLLIEEVQRNLFVSSREIEDYYEANKDRFRRPARVLMRQIIFSLQGQDRAAVEERARTALAELRGGLSMSAVAAKYEGAQLFGGEENSWIAIEDVRPEIASALEGMSVNSYSEPVAGPFAFHILQLLDRQEEVVPPLEEVEDEIYQTIGQQKQTERLESYYDELRSRSFLEIMAPEYAAIEEQWNDASGTTSPTNRRR